MSAEARFQRAVVVANPVSGRGRSARAARELADGLERRGISADLHLTQGRHDGAEYLRSRGRSVDLVCSVGGDGTLRECFEGLEDPEVPVLVLPFGTANVLANELKLPRRAPDAVELACAGRSRAIDVSDVNGRMSFLVTSVGIDAMTVEEVERRRRGPISKLSYVPALMHALRRYRPPRLRVSVDGEPVEGEFGLALIANTGGYGGVMRLDRDAQIDDGAYEIYLFPKGSIPALAGAFVRGTLARLPGGAVRMLRGSRFRVESDEPVPYQVDGDTGGHTPLELRIRATRQRLIVP